MRRLQEIASSVDHLLVDIQPIGGLDQTWKPQRIAAVPPISAAQVATKPGSRPAQRAAPQGPQGLDAEGAGALTSQP